VNVVVTVDNSVSRIEGLEFEDFKKLRDDLSYTPPAATSYYTGRQAYKKYLVDKKGYFPTGLLNRVKKFLFHCFSPEVYTQDDRRIKPNKASKRLFKPTLPHPPYLEQEKAVEAAISADRGVISACTGSGKSLMMALLIAKLQLRTLVIVPSLHLKEQLKSTFLDAFGSLDHIVVENIDSNTLKSHTKFDVLIIDEAHHSASRTYRKLNQTAWKGIYHRFFFTATPYRNQEEEQILFESVAGEIVYDLPYSVAVKRGFVVPVEAYYIELPKTKVKGTTWAQVYSELVTKNVIRNDKIFNLLSRLHEQKLSTLCLVKEIAHGKAIARDIIGFANGEDEFTKMYINAFNNRHLTTLVGTNGVLGEGVDTRPAEYVIIAGLGKSKPVFQQQIGRVMRKYPGKESGKVILVKDASHKWTKAHFAAQVKYLREEYGVEPEKIEV
jgi:superfamily II DNA or RNA helicase